jgi:hypothetical protein
MRLICGLLLLVFLFWQTDAYASICWPWSSPCFANYQQEPLLRLNHLIGDKTNKFKWHILVVIFNPKLTVTFCCGRKYLKIFKIFNRDISLGPPHVTTRACYVGLAPRLGIFGYFRPRDEETV